MGLIVNCNFVNTYVVMFDYYNMYSHYSIIQM